MVMCLYLQGVPEKLFDVWLNMEKNNDIMNGLHGKFILDTRILQIHWILPELQALEVQVSAKDETRGLSIAFAVKVAWGCHLVCFSFISEQTKWDLERMFDNQTFSNMN